MTEHPFPELLKALSHPGPVALCAYRGDPAKRAFGAIYVGSPAEAAAFAEVQPDRDWWFGVNPVTSDVTPPSRGTAAQVSMLLGIWADIDVKPGGMPSWEAARATVGALGEVLGTPASAVVNSGHGLQPYWTFSEPLAIVDVKARAKAEGLLRRWGLMVGHFAELQGGIADTVFDLSRVLRVPGTTNCKGDPVPVGLESCRGTVLDVDTLERVLDELSVPDEPLEAAAEVRVPRGSWAYAGYLCPYVKGMVKGWDTADPGGRHQWLVSQHVRLALAHRVGCLTEKGHQGALVALHRRFSQLLERDRDERKPGRGEWSDAMSWGTRRAESITDPWADLGEGKARPLGGRHQHVIDREAEEDADEPQAAADAGDEVPTDPVATVTLDDAHAVFRKWLSDSYDMDALNVSLATLAVERLDGDPLWTLLVSGSGNAKTETVQACAAGAVMTSTIASVGALLSATAANERAKDASGGLLRQLEPRGVMVIKDVTSVLSMNSNARAEVLGALREVHDGAWDRNVGTDGGKTLQWRGRIAVLGAVTTAWDTAHAVISTMGDRFVLLRMDSTQHRAAAGRSAIGNTGDEAAMRAELRAAAAGVLCGMDTNPGRVTEAEQEALLTAADLVTRARTGVEYDYRGNVIDAHAPEMPTRFAKELAQVLRGGIAIGMPRAEAVRLAIRVARDSMPPLRLLIVDDLAANPYSTPTDVRKRIAKPWSTVDRQLQALHMLGVVDVEEEEYEGVGKTATRWRYSLAEWVDPACLDIEHVTRKVGTPLAP